MARDDQASAGVSTHTPTQAEQRAAAEKAEAKKTPAKKASKPRKSAAKKQPDPLDEKPAKGSTAEKGLPSLAPTADDYKRWEKQGFVGEGGDVRP
jgi:hypothetical protein